MGMTFLNLHLRLHQDIQEQAVSDYLIKRLSAEQYQLVESEDGADVGFALYRDEQDGWLSVYSDAFFSEGALGCEEMAKSLHEAFDTQVLRVGCFDSDYLFLNLIGEGIDAWASIGSAAGFGISRRKKLSDWQMLVKEFPLFKQKLQRNEGCAEDALWGIAPCLELSAERSTADYEHLEDFFPADTVKKLYFRLPDELHTEEPPKFCLLTTDSIPSVEHRNYLSILNQGGASRGLTVQFQGDGFQDGALVPEIISLCACEGKEYCVAGEKTVFENGKIGYVFRFPTFRIPPKVDERLPMAVQVRKLFVQNIGLVYTLRGNPRKVLQVQVCLIPDKNWDGSYVWNPLRGAASKEEFIRYYNQLWEGKPQQLLLREEDYD